jgi:hypothetical protein
MSRSNSTRATENFTVTRLYEPNLEPQARALLILLEAYPEISGAADGLDPHASSLLACSECAGFAPLCTCKEEG